ncbi:MAG: hypothetical protein RMJ89_06470, partial [Flammeovirgaceae bacterium]|nr:hypothetical protein [Flammeovirgaceae bacterium]
MLRSRYTHFFHLSMMLLLAVLTIRCTPTRQLKENEFLLYSQQIKGTKKVSTDELSSYYKQKPNRRLPILSIMPYLHAYYLGKKQYDRKKETWQKELDSLKLAYQREIVALNTQMKKLLQSSLRKHDYKTFRKDSTRLAKKIDRFRQKENEKIEELTLRIEEGNWLMRSVGEPPTIYDRATALHTATQMQKYLIKKGFFKSEVTVIEDTVGKKIHLTYQVKETEPYLIRLFEYEISDSLVFDIVFNERKNSLIQEKHYYDETNLENERKRITNVLRNNGYFDFNSNYIFFEVDSTVGNRCVDVTMIIKNPPMEKRHKQYFMKEIVFLGDVDVNKPQKRDTTFYNGVTYVQASNRYSKRVLDSKIFLKPSQRYDLSKVDNTQSALTGTDMFKFVNINFERIGEDSLQMNLFSSDNDKYQYTFESGLAVTQSIPGPFASLSWKNRNFFRSA